MEARPPSTPSVLAGGLAVVADGDGADDPTEPRQEIPRTGTVEQEEAAAPPCTVVTILDRR